MRKVILVEEGFNPGLELCRMTGRADDGAVASFIGQVRAGGDITHLELEDYPGLTQTALERIADEAIGRWSLSSALILHRLGRMAIGEPIVLTAAAAPHRRAALEAVTYMIDVLKTEAPFWKKEIGAGFARWVEPGPEDNRTTQKWLHYRDERHE